MVELSPNGAPQPPPRRSRYEDKSVSYKQLVYSLPFLAAGLVTFGGFVLAQAKVPAEDAGKATELVRADVQQLRAQVEAKDAGLRDEVRLLRKDTLEQLRNQDAKIERMDDKLDLMLRELRKGH